MASPNHKQDSDMETPGFDNPMMKPFFDFWSRFAKEATGTAWQSMPTPSTLFNPASLFRDWEKRWLDTLSDSFEAYLRTPQFLEWMRQNSDVIVKSKQQADNVAREFARNAGIPTASDISGLYERLHSFEDNLVRRLDKEVLNRINGSESGTGSKPDRDVVARLDRMEETLKSHKNGGDLRRHLDRGVEDLSGRLDRLEDSVMGTLERIEQRLEALERGAPETTRGHSAESRSRPAHQPRTKGPAKSRRPKPRPAGKGQQNGTR